MPPTTTAPKQGLRLSSPMPRTPPQQPGSDYLRHRDQRRRTLGPRPLHFPADPPAVVSIATSRTSTAEREGLDQHLAPTELEETEPPAPKHMPAAADDDDLFASAPTTGNITPVPRSNPVIDVDDDEQDGAAAPPPQQPPQVNIDDDDRPSSRIRRNPG